jgi:hypothetical protein
MTRYSVCVIYFGYVLHQARGGSQGGEAPLHGGSRETPTKKKIGVFCVLFLAIFRHMVFVDGFLNPIKKLWLLNNSSQWIRGLDATIAYIFIVL